MMDVTAVTGALVRECSNTRTGHVARVSLPWVTMRWEDGREESFSRSDPRLLEELEILTVTEGWIPVGRLIGSKKLAEAEATGQIHKKRHSPHKRHARVGRGPNRGERGKKTKWDCEKDPKKLGIEGGSAEPYQQYCVGVGDKNKGRVIVVRTDSPGHGLTKDEYNILYKACTRVGGKPNCFPKWKKEGFPGAPEDLLRKAGLRGGGGSSQRSRGPALGPDVPAKAEKDAGPDLIGLDRTRARSLGMSSAAKKAFAKHVNELATGSDSKQKHAELADKYDEWARNPEKADASGLSAVDMIDLRDGLRDRAGIKNPKTEPLERSRSWREPEIKADPKNHRLAPPKGMTKKQADRTFSANLGKVKVLGARTQSDIERSIAKAFGRVVPIEQVAEISGFAGADINKTAARSRLKKNATNDVRINFRRSLQNGGRKDTEGEPLISFSVNSGEGHIKAMERTLTIQGDGTYKLYNAHFKAAKKTTDRATQGARGTGPAMLAAEVRALENLGIEGKTTIRVTAAQSQAGEEDGYNGGYSWGASGFNTDLWARERAALKAEFGIDAKDMHDLMLKLKGGKGRAWWKKRARGFGGTFDPKPGSNSRTIMMDYLKGKLKQRPGKVTKEALELRSSLLALLEWNQLDEKKGKKPKGEDGWNIGPEDEAILDAAWDRLAKKLGIKQV